MTAKAGPKPRTRLQGLRWLLLILATLLVAARLFTGLVYEFDEPTTYLVLKCSPGWAVEQKNTAQDRVSTRFIVLDSEENALGYETPYLWLMRAALPLAAGTCVLAWVAGRRRRA